MIPARPKPTSVNVPMWDLSGAAPRELLRVGNTLGATSRFVPSGEFVTASNGEGGVHIGRMR